MFGDGFFSKYTLTIYKIRNVNMSIKEDTSIAPAGHIATVLDHPTIGCDDDLVVVLLCCLYYSRQQYHVRSYILYNRIMK